MGVAISQSSFFGMTLYKLISENLWRKSCLAGMMLKEGICMFLAILSEYFFLICFSAGFVITDTIL